MWRQTVLACALVTGVLSEAASARTPVLIGFEDRDVRLAVTGAVEAAAARLACGRCQKVLSDFTDENGQLLSAKLAAIGRDPAEAFGLLWFVDSPLAPQCRAGNRLAFTYPGSQVIHICSWQFRPRSIRNRSRTELLVIHEFLHTLGLGENPPTSQAITKQVALRCGG